LKRDTDLIVGLGILRHRLSGVLELQQCAREVFLLEHPFAGFQMAIALLLGGLRTGRPYQRGGN
jgi:hypothetical protein